MGPMGHRAHGASGPCRRPAAGWRPAGRRPGGRPDDGGRAISETAFKLKTIQITKDRVHHRVWLVHTNSCSVCKLFKYVVQHTRRTPRGCAAPLWWCVLLHIRAVCIYTRKRYTPVIFFFVLGPNLVVVYTYIYGVPKGTIFFAGCFVTGRPLEMLSFVWCT